MTGKTAPSFIHDLRKALNHLYDPAELRNSLLVTRFGIDPRSDTVASLRKILKEAIEAIRPDKNTPPEANAWRIYWLLTRRFIEQSPQDEVAGDLSLGIRQYRRYESAAISVLADYLRVHHGIAPALQENSEGGTDENQVPSKDKMVPTRQQELDWLQESLPSESVHVISMVQAALKTIEPLVNSLDVKISYEIPPDLPNLAGQPTTLRQALLSVLTTTVRNAPNGNVCIKARVSLRGIELHISSSNKSGMATPLNKNELDRLEVARQLAEMLGGSLVLTQDKTVNKLFNIFLCLPAAGQVPVMVIDDNTDTLKLLQRYLSGTRYKFIGIRDPEEALTTASQTLPKMIVLDVMLPKIDGWELLGRLHEHPSLRNVPIIICTILPEEHLALTLGASGFIQKPVSRRDFLAVLDQQSAPQGQESD